MLKVDPFPSLLLLTHIFPLCALIMLLHIYKPNPEPEFELVTNLSKIDDLISSAIPIPVSLI